ncbi:MAG: hypothetical protein KGN84_10740 [Acidobacteriota bacterium]|nr:hypothetical protein [Acidobacteriota bacterium]
MTLFRGVLGVFAGYAILALTLHYFGPGPTGTGMNYFLTSAAWTVGAALAAGFVTALIAGQREFAAVSALSLVIIAASVVSIVRQGESTPGWYETSVAGIGPMAAILGAGIRMLFKRRPAGRETVPPAG